MQGYLKSLYVLGNKISLSVYLFAAPEIQNKLIFNYIFIW